MFGLTIEKLIVVAVIAALIIGPHRLPEYAQKLGTLVRSFKDILDETKTRAATETGVADLQADLQTLNPRQYDPRRIIREALETPPSQDETVTVPEGDPQLIAAMTAMSKPGIGQVQAEHPIEVPDLPVPGEQTQNTPTDAMTDINQTQPETEQRPPGRWKVTGSSAHPRRVWIPDEPVEWEADDPEQETRYSRASSA